MTGASKGQKNRVLEIESGEERERDGGWGPHVHIHLIYTWRSLSAHRRNVPVPTIILPAMVGVNYEDDTVRPRTS